MFKSKKKTMNICSGIINAINILLNLIKKCPYYRTTHSGSFNTISNLHRVRNFPYQEL